MGHAMTYALRRMLLLLLLHMGFGGVSTLPQAASEVSAPLAHTDLVHRQKR